MKNLFSYGTLMCDEIMQAVSGHHRSSLPASLKGYRRCSVSGEAYPAISPDPAGCVAGVVYLNVAHQAWGRLDEYEGEMYSRETVQVELEDGRAILAETYVVMPAFVGQLDVVDWDYEYFLEHEKKRYLEKIK